MAREGWVACDLGLSVGRPGEVTVDGMPGWIGQRPEPQPAGKAARTALSRRGPVRPRSTPGATRIVHERLGPGPPRTASSRRAADFTEENPGYDQEAIDDFRDTATRLEEKAAPGK